MKLTDLIVDVDGTLVDTRELTSRWLRGELEGSLAEAAIHAEPIAPVVAWVRAHLQAGTRVHIVTARPEEEREYTLALLERLGLSCVASVTHKPRGVFRIDTAYKRHWVQTRIASPTTALAIDDNPYITDMYEQIGLPVIQVPGWDVFDETDPASLELPEVNSSEDRSSVQRGR